MVVFYSWLDSGTMDNLAQILGSHSVPLHVHDRRLALFRLVPMSLKSSQSRFLLPKLANRRVVP